VRPKAAPGWSDGFAVEDVIGLSVISVSFFLLFDYIAEILVG
jgi:hypothetical protein